MRAGVFAGSGVCSSQARTAVGRMGELLDPVRAGCTVLPRMGPQLHAKLQERIAVVELPILPTVLTVLRYTERCGTVRAPTYRTKLLRGIHYAEVDTSTPTGTPTNARTGRCSVLMKVRRVPAIRGLEAPASVRRTGPPSSGQ